MVSGGGKTYWGTRGGERGGGRGGASDVALLRSYTGKGGRLWAALRNEVSYLIR